jgi:antitoxin (DNA-binding transcriptional repressor) of toxin-antitoxin stability system
MVKMVDLSEPDASLAELVRLATSGTQIILTRLGSPVARLVPVDAGPQPRTPDLHPGAFQPSDDFDAPLPDAFWVGDA